MGTQNKIYTVRRKIVEKYEVEGRNRKEAMQNLQHQTTGPSEVLLISESIRLKAFIK